MLFCVARAKTTLHIVPKHSHHWKIYTTLNILRDDLIDFKTPRQIIRQGRRMIQLAGMQPDSPGAPFPGGANGRAQH